MKKKKIRYDVAKIETVRELLELAVFENGDTVAFKYRVGRADDEIAEVSYSEFSNSCDDLLASLSERGFETASCGCVGNNSYAWILAYVSALKGGNVFVPLDRELPESDLLNILSETSPSVLFFGNTHKAFIESKIDELSFVKLFVGLDAAAVIDDARFVSISTLLSEGKELPRSTASREVDDVAMIVYTSGTTGLAKGVMLSERNICSCVYNTMRISTLYDSCVAVLPLHHTFSSVGVLCSMHLHSTICINDSLRNVLRDIQTFKPSYIYLVPRFAEIFYDNIKKKLNQKGIERKFETLVKLSNFLRKLHIDLRHLFFKEIHNNFGGRMRKIVTGGAPIRGDIGEFFDSVGIPLVNGYGITECSPVISANREGGDSWSTAGEKVDCLEWRIDTPNEEGIGEICVKGETVMLGYYKNPEATAEVIVDGWFHTGDYGRLDGDQLVITGRKKNVIVLNNGKNIYPEEIEGYIQRIEYVAEVVVRGMKNEYGEDCGLTAELYFSDGIERKAEEVLRELRQVMRELPNYKHIASVIIRKTEFPKTTTAKIRRTHA